jgi:hypothetical protein
LLHNAHARVRLFSREDAGTLAVFVVPQGGSTQSARAPRRRAAIA